MTTTMLTSRKTARRRAAAEPHPYFAGHVMALIHWRGTAWWVEMSDIKGHWLFWDEDSRAADDRCFSFLVAVTDVERAVAAGDMVLNEG